jgi:hypothetical protein
MTYRHDIKQAILTPFAMTEFRDVSILVKANALDEPHGTKMLAVLKIVSLLSENSSGL